MSANICSASICMSPIPGKGVAGRGLLIAYIKSNAALAAASTDNKCRTLAVVGKNSTVSATCSKCVLVMYTL
eukprot:5454757-Ditylum_brightwellii.AAC.1